MTMGERVTPREMTCGRRGLSPLIIVLSGFLLATSLCALFLGLRHVRLRFSPTFTNAERFLLRGKFDEAFAFAEDIGGETSEKALLRGRIFLARSLRKQCLDGWRRYGTDSLDWLQEPDIDSALLCFRNSLELDPESATANYYLGVVFKEKGWFREAEDAFRETLRLSPEHIEAGIALGSLFSMMDRQAEAVECLYDAFRLAPRNPQVAKNMALLYRFHLEKPDSAIIWFNRYLEFAQPNDRDITGARHELRELVQRYPEFSPPPPGSWKKGRRRFFPR